MANNNQNSAAVLPLPPLEYDVQYLNNVVRIINFWIQQTQNPGSLRATGLTVIDREGKVALSIDSAAKVDLNVFVVAELPTSATGLAKNQVWRDPVTNILHVTPP